MKFVTRTYQIPLVEIDPLHRLGTVERALREIFQDSAPSRPTLIEMCERGDFEARQFGPRRDWYVYKSSLDRFILELQTPRQQKLAA